MTARRCTRASARATHSLLSYSRRASIVGAASLIAACAYARGAQAHHNVTVRARVPSNVGTVYLTGNLAELGPWKADALAMQGEGELRLAHLTIPHGARFEYKFTLGSWALEGLGPSGTVMGNNVLIVDADKDVTIDVIDFKKDARVYIDDWRNSGVIGRLDYLLDVQSAHLDLPRHVEIWLPPDYDSTPDARFPVLYMHDGQNLFDPRIANTGVDWGVDEACVALAAEGLIARAPIVVGVWSTDKRRFEYAPEKVLGAIDDEVKARAAAEFPEGLLGDACVRFLAEELKPRIDSAYRTLSDRANTTIMGSSMGALISLYAMAERPDIYGAAGCVSMHWPVGISSERVFGDEATWRPAIVTAFSRYLRASHLDPEVNRLWVDHGTGFLDEHYVGYQAAMIPVLHEMGYVENHTLAARIYPGADHNESAWRTRVREPLQFLLGTAL